MTNQCKGMKPLLLKLLILTISIFINQNLNAQNLSVTTGASTSGLGLQQFLLPATNDFEQDVTVEIRGRQVRFLNSDLQFSNIHDISRSESGQYVALLTTNESTYEVIVVENGVTKLASYDSKVEIRSDDPSVQIYALNNGGVVIRNNILFYDFFSPTGEIEASVSALRGTNIRTGLSQLAMSENQSGFFFYIPEIFYGSNRGSVILRFAGDENHIRVFESSDQTISSLDVLDNGSRLLVHLISNQGNHSAVMLDANGTVINSIDLDFEPLKLSLTRDGNFLVAQASARVVVMNASNGNRVGATSIRSGSIILSDYLPQSDTILILSGDQDNSRIRNAQITTVNIGERSINRAEVPVVLGYHPRLPLTFDSLRAGLYVMRGAHQNLVIRLD